MKTSLPEPEIVTRKGKPVSVIIPIESYVELLEQVEDVEDTVNVRRQEVLSSKEPRKFRFPARWMAVSMSSIAPNSESRSVMSRFRTSSPGRR